MTKLINDYHYIHCGLLERYARQVKDIGVLPGLLSDLEDLQAQCCDISDDWASNNATLVRHNVMARTLRNTATEASDYDQVTLCSTPYYLLRYTHPIDS